MVFSILPAIDVYRGRLARYAASGPVPVGSFGGDPALAAEAFAARGCRWIHLVDMVPVFDGGPADPDVVASIRHRCPDVAIQISGGITTWEAARTYLDAGATRFVVGSAALVDEPAVFDLLSRAGAEALVGLEIEAGRILSRGRDRVELDLSATLAWLVALEPPGFLVTAVDRVGELRGPDVALVRRVAGSGVPTLAAGGIAGPDDLRSLRAAGAVGAVVGRGALEGGLDLADALAWAALDRG